MTDRKGLGMKRKVAIYRILWSYLRLDAATKVGLVDVITLEDHKSALADAQAAVEALQAQLPAEMQGCTILFKECEKGHGRLVATNWRDHGCQTCEVEALQREWDRLREALEALVKLVDDGLLVRSVANDHIAGWGIRVLPIVQALQQAQAALTPGEGGQDE